MKEIIEQLKRQRAKAERSFIDNSLIKRNYEEREAPPPPATLQAKKDLDLIYQLNGAISVLENTVSAKYTEISEKAKELKK